MKEFSLRQLEYFVAVVEAESVTVAARRLRVSPSGVSLALKELESSLKVQLTLRRRGKGVSVTPAGRWVYEHARTVLGGASEISAVARIVRGELAGPLRVGCFTTLSPWLFPRIAAYFVEQHPGVDVHLVEDESAVLQESMSMGELDAALIYSNHLVPGIASEEIAPVRLQIAISPAHRLAAFDEVPLHELENETAILLGLQPATSHVEDILRAAGLEPRVRWRSKNVETIRSMVARGLGYTIIMGRPSGDRTYEGLPLAYRRIADDIPPNSVVITYPEGTIPTAKVRTLIAFCRQEFAKESQLMML